MNKQDFDLQIARIEESIVTFDNKYGTDLEKYAYTNEPMFRKTITDGLAQIEKVLRTCENLGMACNKTQLKRLKKPHDAFIEIKAVFTNLLMGSVEAVKAAQEFEQQQNANNSFVSMKNKEKLFS